LIKLINIIKKQKRKYDIKGWTTAECRMRNMLETVGIDYSSPQPPTTIHEDAQARQGTIQGSPKLKAIIFDC